MEKHLAADRVDQPADLGDRNEHVRRDIAMDGMRPARQRLDGDDLARLGIDDRLIADVDLFVLDRALEILLEPLAPFMAFVERGVVDPRAVPARTAGDTIAPRRTCSWLIA